MKYDILYTNSWRLNWTSRGNIFLKFNYSLYSKPAPRLAWARQLMWMTQTSCSGKYYLVTRTDGEKPKLESLQQPLTPAGQRLRMTTHHPWRELCCLSQNGSWLDGSLSAQPCHRDDRATTGEPLVLSLPLWSSEHRKKQNKTNTNKRNIHNAYNLYFLHFVQSLQLQAIKIRGPPSLCRQPDTRDPSCLSLQAGCCWALLWQPFPGRIHPTKY